jgi:hypothetical protein
MAAWLGKETKKVHETDLGHDHHLLAVAAQREKGADKTKPGST